MSENSMIDELREANDESYNKWFERWYQKENIPSNLKKSAQQGYSGYTIPIELPQEASYLNVRLRDSRTIERLKEKLPGVKVEFVEINRKDFLGLNHHKEQIRFSGWKDEK